MTRLFIVEGLPCSGKSTTAKYMAERLSAMGRRVLCVDEGTGEHPADYEQSAYVTGGQLASFPPGLREMIRSRSEPRLDGYVVPLSKLGGAALQRLIPYKIYDSLPWETEMPLMLDKWRSFTESAEEHMLYVFNAVLLQNPMCETMMRFNFSMEQSLEYIEKIAEIIAPMDPAVIYLKSDNIAESVRAVSEERPGWLESVIGYHVNGAYGESIGAKGFEGYIACLEERQRRELEILERLGINRLVLEGPRQEWNTRICSFIGVRPRSF
ncbi:hypothetical protein [Acutalibacter muris]|jgi:hypothetical protein|uniref:hypothetical protein n=1 Tax=Acutalibacter muris TaxID=1796620 RepID=UPI0026F3CDF9|nr:hypothetical protein [Acutalibacter muris]